MRAAILPYAIILTKAHRPIAAVSMMAKGNTASGLFLIFE